jgi:hypothetical protein
MSQTAAEGIREATRVMKRFAEDVLPRMVIAERLTEGSRRWWAEWKRGRS